MGNHEYHINWQGNYDVISVFANLDKAKHYDDLNELFKIAGFNDVQKEAYALARSKFLKMADENDWY